MVFLVHRLMSFDYITLNPQSGGAAVTEGHPIGEAGRAVNANATVIVGDDGAAGTVIGAIDDIVVAVEFNAVGVARWQTCRRGPERFIYRSAHNVAFIGV